MGEWIKKHLLLIILFLLVAMTGVPLIIHVLFKIYPNNSFWIAEWSAGEFLSYYGAILSFVGTVALGALALYQNDLFKKQNDKIMQLQNVPYFSHVNLEPTGQVKKKVQEELPAGIYLKSEEANEIILTAFDTYNLSDYPICSISAKRQGFDSLQKRWIGITGYGDRATKKVILPPGKGQELYVGVEPFWKGLKVMGFSDKLCGVELTFTNTNGLSTQGRIVFYKDSRPCKYNLIPLQIEQDSESFEE